MSKKLGVLGALFTAVMLLLPSAPAQAGSEGVSVAIGGGNFSTLQSGSLALTLTGTFGGVTGGLACNFTFQSTSTTGVIDQGTFQGTCGGAATVVCGPPSLRYVRVAHFMTLSGICTVNGAAVSVIGELSFVPMSPPGQPVTSYAISGEFASHGASGASGGA